MENQRTDFEAWATRHYADFGQIPNFTRAAKQPHNYADLNINALWWGWQAGQSAMTIRADGKGA